MTPKSIARCIVQTEKMEIAEINPSSLEIGDQIIYWIFTPEMTKKYRTGTIAEIKTAQIGLNSRVCYSTAEAPQLWILGSQISRVINKAIRTNQSLALCRGT